MSNPDYGALVAELRGLPEGDGTRVVVIASAVHGEGVTTVTRELAAALALRDHAKVLVVDANSRNADTEPGDHRDKLQELLDRVSDDEADVREVMAWRKRQKPSQEEEDEEKGGVPIQIGAAARHDHRDSRSMVTTAQFSPGQIDFLNKRQLDGAFAEFRSQFEWILIDAPPVTVYPEAAMLASMADTTVLVVRAESTRWEVADKAKRIIQQAGGDILGAILSHRRYHIPDVVYRRL